MTDSSHPSDKSGFEWLCDNEKSYKDSTQFNGDNPQDSKTSAPYKQSSPTTHLAEKADVVREVARKIGRARVKWDNPQSVMIITKPGDLSLVRKTRQLALWFMRTPRYGKPSGITVYVDEKLKKSKRFKLERFQAESPELIEKLKFWTPELCATHPKLFDFIVTLGGDGTVLFTSWLFQSVVPPVIPFHLGSLGFLTPFDFDHHQYHLTQAMENGVRINLRVRFTCTVYRRVPSPNCTKAKDVQLRNVKRNTKTGKVIVGDWCERKMGHKKTQKVFGEVDGDDVKEENIAQWIEEDGEDGQKMRVPCFTTVPAEKYQVLNDLVVDRGQNSFMGELELFGSDGAYDQHLTTVAADGLIVATPTGSTAYSLSGGGPLTHPDIPAMLITPICPHTLSFRPTLVPDTIDLRICVPYTSRSTAWVSFDGRGRVELKQGDHVKVTASRYPLPTICKKSQSDDWFNSLSRCLHWNERQRQKSFVVVESNRSQHKSTTNQPSVGRQNSISHPSSRSASAISLPKLAAAASPPHSTSHTPFKRQPPYASSSSSGSENGQDEVFAMFEDDKNFSPPMYSHRRSSAGGWSQSSDSSPEFHAEDTLGKNYDDAAYESSDDSDDDEDGFVGWNDEELLRARQLAGVAHDLQKLHTSH
ncbi:ATP-NAD kinase-like domain-containing protein [Umbelopsis sp. AD052]|nr:ATP-NAD kinase-like domain-containing protein [Umbelopsis sp. AD052]